MVNSPQQYAKVALPGGMPEPLWYGLPEGQKLKAGSLVYAGLRKKRLLGVILVISSTDPGFKVRILEAHPSRYCFAPVWIETVQWIAECWLCSENQVVDCFWPSRLEKYLESKEAAFVPPEDLEELPPLSADQDSVLRAMLPDLEAGRHALHLLHGVTGSGKSRVYLELAKFCLAKGRSVLVLVPEIGLTPQTCAFFEEGLDCPVAILHSGLSEPKRRRVWKALLDGSLRVLLGTRSAVLAPLPNLGLVVLDEEHDASFKQHEGTPRYHTREVAMKLASCQNAMMVMGSATPSLESWFLASQKKIRLHTLSKRILGLALPKVRVVDMKRENRLQGNRALSPQLREALQDCITAGKQAVILHNRRGFSTSRSCSECGEVQKCLDCDIPLVWHKSTDRLHCHYCSRIYTRALPCESCGSANFEMGGRAIEQVEEEIRIWVPGAEILRFDRDSTARKGSAEKILKKFRSRKADILLGTQMVAKGHDFPGVQLVGVVDTGAGMSLPDFRAAERTFQLLSQVAGRAGRSSEGGEVIFQTRQPDLEIMGFALHHDYNAFAEWELESRASLRYPPYCRLLSVEVDGRDRLLVQKTLEGFALELRRACEGLEQQVLGPSEAMVPVVRGRFRMILLLKGAAGNQMRWSVEQALAKTGIRQERKLKIRVDMDPQSLA